MFCTCAIPGVLALAQQALLEKVESDTAAYILEIVCIANASRKGKKTILLRIY